MLSSVLLQSYNHKATERDVFTNNRNGINSDNFIQRTFYSIKNKYVTQKEMVQTKEIIFLYKKSLIS